MSHTNSTTNYSLPQFLTTDKPFWLTDVNQAYVAIDTGMKNAQDTADAAQSTATTAASDASDALTNAAAADAKGTGAISSIANAFSDSSTYNVGDIVMYNNLLYRCTVAVIVPGTWTGSANWTRITLASSLSINDMTDVDIASVASGDLLQFDGNDFIPVNSLLLTRSFTATGITIPAGGAQLVTATDFSISEIPGYAPIAINSFTSYSNQALVRSANAATSGTILTVTNPSAAAVTSGFSITILFARTSLIGE